MKSETRRGGVIIIWLLSIFIITVGVYNFIVSIFVVYSLSDLLIGLSDAIAGLIIFPPFGMFLKKIFKIDMPPWMKGVLFFLLFAVSNGIYLMSNYLS
jgi:hypothetical protein